MKRIYSKPVARRVAFSYQEQVMAQSGYNNGDISNRDDTKKCQFFSGTCNTAWNVNTASSASLFSLDDCLLPPEALG